MLRGFSLSLGGYALSAVVFVVFSIVFVRAHGAETYGEFSLLLNTVSALTLFANYHGALVTFSAAAERIAFLRMLRPVAAYSVATAAVAGAALAVIGDLSWTWGLPIAVAFVLVIAAGLPAAALMASPGNWLVNLSRAIYQSLLIVGFWVLFGLGVGVAAAFVWSLMLAAAVYFCLIASRVSFPAQAAQVGAAPRGILWIALGWNLAVMGIMLLDKASIRFLQAGATAADVGVFLLYFDIAGRLSAIYAIAMAPFTYELLQRSRRGDPLVPPISIGVGTALVMGLAGLAIGEFLIPVLYGVRLGDNVWLPAIVGAYIAHVGASSVLLAFCNATGRVRFPLWHYASILLISAGTIAAIYTIEGRIGITQLALAIAAGYGFTLISALLVAHSHRANTHVAGIARISPLALPAMPKQ